MLSPDYLPNTAASAPALAQLMALTVEREAARLQAEAARVAAREAAARERSLLGARAAEAGVGLQRLPQLQHWRPAPLKSLAQLQQQYEQEAAAAATGDDEDDDVVIVSSDEGEGGSDQQQYEVSGVCGGAQPLRGALRMRQGCPRLRLCLLMKRQAGSASSVVH